MYRLTTIKLLTNLHVRPVFASTMLLLSLMVDHFLLHIEHFSTLLAAKSLGLPLQRASGTTHLLRWCWAWIRSEFQKSQPKMPPGCRSRIMHLGMYEAPHAFLKAISCSVIGFALIVRILWSTASALTTWPGSRQGFQFAKPCSNLSNFSSSSIAQARICNGHIIGVFAPLLGGNWRNDSNSSSTRSRSLCETCSLGSWSANMHSRRDWQKSSYIDNSLAHSAELSTSPNEKLSGSCERIEIICISMLLSLRMNVGPWGLDRRNIVISKAAWWISYCPARTGDAWARRLRWGLSCTRVLYNDEYSQNCWIDGSWGAKIAWVE